MDMVTVMKRGLNDWAEELKVDMAVNKFRLDDECAVQTAYYSKWALLSTLASMERDLRQKELDEETAHLDYEVRSAPEKFGVRDIKENAVKAVIANDPKIGKLRRDLIEAAAYAKLFNGAINACDQKKTMLRELGDLWIAEYYSDVQVKEWEADEDLREKMKIRRGRK